MKIALAQIKSDIGNLESNIKKHIEWIKEAVAIKAGLIVFPELSLSGYAPTLAEKMAIDANDDRLEVFQKISNENNISILLGAPLKGSKWVTISMLIFQPMESRKVYSKQRLHPDEMLYFHAGKNYLLIPFDKLKIAPAICYESLDETHLVNALQQEANLYLASVAKGEKGINKAYLHYERMAKKYSIPILLCNCVGECEDFLGYGNSGIWNNKGILLKKLLNDKEGLLFYDLQTERLEA